MAVTMMKYFAIMALLVLPLAAAQADGEGDIQVINSAGQMYPGTSGCNSSSSRGCDDPNHKFNANQAANYSTDKLVRRNAKVENLRWQWTAPPVYPDQGGSAGSWEATGEYTCSTNRSWNFRKTGGTLCWGSMTLYSIPNCAGARNSQSFGSQEPGNLVSAGNGCAKGACAVDYQPMSSPHFVTAATGDNMMALLPPSEGAKGFFVNNYCQGNVPYWLEREGGSDASKYMMIPSKCTDYNTYMDADPPQVKVEGACHPASLAMCPSPPSNPPMPAHPGCGGYSHGSSWCVEYATGTSCSGSGKDQVCHEYTYCARSNYCDCGTVRG